MFSKFSEEARHVLAGAKKEMSNLKHPYVGSEHLILSILSNKNNIVTKKLNSYNLNYKNFKEEIINIIGVGSESNNWFLYTPLLKRVIEDAIINSRESSEKEVTIEHLLMAMLEEGEGVAIRIMINMDIDIDELYNEFTIKSKTKEKSKKKMLIDEYGYDMNKKVLANEIDPVIGRDLEVERIVEILCRRTKNNPLLIGEAGVGKSALVEELSRRIVNGNVPFKLKDKRIVSIAMSSLVSGTKYRGEFEERITKMLKEIENDDSVIVFIDEIHTLVGAGGAEGAIDASNILKPALARGKIKVIGATTVSEYKKYIEDDRALARRFQTVNIEEPDRDKVYDILCNLRPIYESFHGVTISDEILKLITDLSNKYIYDRKQPDKAIDILDEVASKVSVSKDDKIKKIEYYKTLLKEIIDNKNKSIVENDFNTASLFREEEKKLADKINKMEYKQLTLAKSKKVTKEMIAEVIKLKTKIPVYELVNDNENLNKLETNLKKTVIGQDVAIKTICNITKRIRMGFKDNRLPSSILLVGPTGVGKTYLVKEYNKYLFNEDNLIRLDMSEYKEEHSISKIIGSPPGYVGYENKNTVLDEVKRKPHGIILLDEIEKAHKSVVNLFLQILDEGKIKDSAGNIHRFDNNMIIMTSNLGCTKKNIGFGDVKESAVLEKVKEYLGVEFVNRIDSLIIFSRLKREDIKEIVSIKLKAIKEKFSLNDIKDINITEEVIEELINLSDYEVYGARRINKVIIEKVEAIIIDNIIEGNKNIKIEKIK